MIENDAKEKKLKQKEVILELLGIAMDLSTTDPIEHQDFEVCHYCSALAKRDRETGEYAVDHADDCLWLRASVWKRVGIGVLAMLLVEG